MESHDNGERDEGKEQKEMNRFLKNTIEMAMNDVADFYSSFQSNNSIKIQANTILRAHRKLQFIACSWTEREKRTDRSQMSV